MVTNMYNIKVHAYAIVFTSTDVNIYKNHKLPLRNAQLMAYPLIDKETSVTSNGKWTFICSCSGDLCMDGEFLFNIGNIGGGWVGMAGTWTQRVLFFLCVCSVE